MKHSKVLALTVIVCILTSMLMVGCVQQESSSKKEEPAVTQETKETPKPEEKPKTEEKTEEASIKAPAGFPKKEITIIVPVAAGGSLDMSARQLSAILKEMYGITLIVQNVEGGGGVTGMTQALTSKPDGYTIAFWSVNFMANIILGRYDLKLNMVDYLCTATEESQTLCVGGNSEIKTFEDFVKYVKANPGNVSVAAPGVLNQQQVSIRKLSEVIFGKGKYDEINYVSATGGSRVAADLMGDSIIDAGLLKPSEMASGFQAGQIRPIVVLSPERLSICPEVPTLTELGYEFIPYVSGVYNSTMIYCPPGVDAEIKDYLTKVIVSAFKSDAFQEYITSMDAKSAPLGGKELEDTIAVAVEEYSTWNETYLKGLIK